MKIFGTCVKGSIALVRDDGEVFLGYNLAIPDGDMNDVDIMLAARTATNVAQFQKVVSANMGRAINGATRQLVQACYARRAA